jgi:hypothetical protein
MRRGDVCLQIYQSWKDYYFECAYTSLAQCNMSASGRAAQSVLRRPKTTKPPVSPRLLSGSRTDIAPATHFGSD